jgi:hypothetical protein
MIRQIVHKFGYFKFYLELFTYIIYLVEALQLLNATAYDRRQDFTAFLQC